MGVLATHQLVRDRPGREQGVSIYPVQVPSDAGLGDDRSCSCFACAGTLTSAASFD